jgi:hypothetical protein
MRWFTNLVGKKLRIAGSSRKPHPRLQLEEFEPRWVPSGTTTTSTNWSGYAVNSTTDSVTAVSGTWTVPTVTGSGTAYSSTWVGIDGYLSSSVEQTGISADISKGVAQYSAWYEMFPSDPVTINLAIHPGDEISASVDYASGKFTLSIQDLSDPAGKNSFSISISDANLQRSSAEWIEEAPSSNTGVLPLANFGSVTFSNAQTTINGVTGPINDSAWANNVVAINMAAGRGTVEASTSSLNASGTGFTVTYGDASTPSPPVPSPPAPSPPAPSPPTPSPPAPSPPTTPQPGSVATTTKLVGVVDPSYWGQPTVTLTAIVSPSVPVGSEVELLSGTTVLGIGYVKDVRGVDEVSFVVSFNETGTYTFTAEYVGAGQYESSTSNTLTVTVSDTNRSRSEDSYADLAAFDRVKSR